MAIMIPALGPHETESPGEPTVYKLLRQGLNDEYTVIHSLPWLCAAVRDIDKNFAPTGEIDFLVVHPDLGVLALEVKSGRYRVEGAVFVRNSSEPSKNPISQVRRNVHGLTKWLGADPELRIRFGYGFVFPDSRFGEAVISPALIDTTVEPIQRIFVDQEQMPNLAARVREMLAYWKSAGGTHLLGKEKAKRLIETLCPMYDGTPSWGQRVAYDNHVWLRLTREQTEVLERASASKRMVVTGWPGTGKTLIGAELANRAASAGRKVLFVTFNSLLRNALQDQLSSEEQGCSVMTWHGLCGEARRRLGYASEHPKEWLEAGCLTDLSAAIKADVMGGYDVLILDEAQALRSEWVEALFAWFRDGQIIALCDETQVFRFEQGRVTLAELCGAMGVAPFILTMVLRMPKAVTQSLLNFRQVNYQLFCPRPLDADALQERIFSDWNSALSGVLEELLRHGLQGQDIAVLTRFSPDQASPTLNHIIATAGVRHESVARFRGIESPAVVVLRADDMDDVELFSAYSRATTICIALYDAEELAWKANGSFQTRLLEDDGIRSQVQEAKRQSLTATWMAERLAEQIVGVDTVRLTWFSQWHSWLVELGAPGDSGETWIDHLVTAHPWPVFYWYRNSRHSINVALPAVGLDEDIHVKSLHLRKCKTCGERSPHQSHRDEECVFCDGAISISKEIPWQTDFETLGQFDTAIHQLAYGKSGKESNLDLPISLVAVGARLYAEKNQQRTTAVGIELPCRNILYRTALALIFARVTYLKSGTTFTRASLTEKPYKNFRALQSVPFERWAMWTALAVSTCTNIQNNKKLLVKVKKGVYSAIEESDAGNGGSE